MTINHILIAEDEAHTRLSLNILLKRAGYRVSSVSDGAKALDLILKSVEKPGESIELLMTDIQMPDMSGLELIRTLKAKGVKLPILVFTGFGDKETLVELLREGCEDYIDKPFTEEALMERIKSVLEKEAKRRKEREEAAAKLRDIQRKLENYRNAFSSTCDSLESAVSAYKRIIGMPVKSGKLEVAVRSVSKDRLGGDYCAVKDCPWGCDLIMADVAGHDMGASYHTVLVKSFFDVNCELGNNGEEFLQILNRELFKDGSNERMVCALFARLNLQEMWIESVSAAQPFLLDFKPGATEPSSKIDFKSASSPLGMFEKPSLEVRKAPLVPGERLFVFSDGVMDARRLDIESGIRRKFGEEGLLEAFRNNAGKSLQETVDGVWAQIMNYCAFKADDDMLLLGVEIPLTAKSVQKEE